LADW